MIYSIGLFYLPASTYSLICATQTAFNAVFSHLISSKKFTALILNSGCPLIFISHIVVNDDSDGLSGASKWQYIIGFLYTLRAFALHSLCLSLMHLPFQKVLKRETYSVVLEMQICTALVATCVSIVGNGRLFVWKW